MAGEHLDPGGRPGSGVAIVQGPALDLGSGIGCRHRDHAGLQLECGRDAVEGLQPMAAHALRVAVQVDEPWRDHTARAIEDEAPAQVGADGRDACTLDRKIHRRVETLSGVDHTPAADHHGKFAHALSLRRP